VQQDRRRFLDQTDLENRPWAGDVIDIGRHVLAATLDEDDGVTVDADEGA
jgi:hypothetical protein